MKRIAIAALIVLTLGATQAGYTVKVPIDGINFQDFSWQPTDQLASSWVNQGNPTSCTNWTPREQDRYIGESFSQTGTGCQQEQIRTVQHQEINYKGVIRSVNEPITETQTISISYTKETTGTGTSWLAFADTKKLSNDWDSLDWSSQTLHAIPNTPYPNTYISNLYLNNNQLTNVDGLSVLTGFGLDLNLGNNNLTNIDGLSSLTSGANLYLNNNQLTNVDGLSSLTMLVGSLYLNNNQLTNISGLAKLLVLNSIRIDASFNGPKLAANSRFCTLNTTSKFEAGFAQKTQLCN